MKTPLERIQGVSQYYESLLNTDSFASLQSMVQEKFGKRTQEKVIRLLKEAHTFGVLIGLAEAKNILSTDVLGDKTTK